MNMTVAVSGGMDSLFALIKLKQEGHSVRAVYARLVPSSLDNDPVPGLKTLCQSLGIEFQVLDLCAEFENLVITPFAREYARAKTPNPCAQCNRFIKFGLLMEKGATLAGLSSSAATSQHSECSEYSGLLSDELFVTGHYASMEEHAVYGRTLRAGVDKAKDQSYFLALTPVEKLRQCLFPLAGTTKDENRKWLLEHGYEPPLPGESQEICFVPNDDYRGFLASRGAKLSGPGPVVLQDSQTTNSKKIGIHQGLWRYTEGQRKGLGIAWTEPLFVVARNREKNTLVVGTKAQLAVNSCTAEHVNFLVPPQNWPAQLFVRTRYRQEPQAATVECSEGCLKVTFASLQTPTAAGQVLAVYDEAGFVLAGGILV